MIIRSVYPFFPTVRHYKFTTTTCLPVIRYPYRSTHTAYRLPFPPHYSSAYANRSYTPRFMARHLPLAVPTPSSARSPAAPLILTSASHLSYFLPLPGESFVVCICICAQLHTATPLWTRLGSLPLCTALDLCWRAPFSLSPHTFHSPVSPSLLSYGFSLPGFCAGARHCSSLSPVPLMDYHLPFCSPAFVGSAHLGARHCTLLPSCHIILLLPAHAARRARSSPSAHALNGITALFAALRTHARLLPRYCCRLCTPHRTTRCTHAVACARASRLTPRLPPYRARTTSRALLLPRTPGSPQHAPRHTTHHHHLHIHVWTNIPRCAPAPRRICAPHARRCAPPLPYARASAFRSTRTSLRHTAARRALALPSRIALLPTVSRALFWTRCLWLTRRGRHRRHCIYQHS